MGLFDFGRTSKKQQDEIIDLTDSPRKSYTASQFNRTIKRWLRKNRTTDKEIKEYQTIRSRSYDLYRNNAIVTGAVDINALNIVGKGIYAQSNVDAQSLGISDEEAEEISQQIDREFHFWASSTACDAEKTQNFYEITATAFIGKLLGGDSFILLPRIEDERTPYTTTIALIEADQVCNPYKARDTDKLAGGVEINKWGAPIKYHIANRHPGGYTKPDKWIEIEARDEDDNPNILQIFTKKRPGQKRGVPYVAPIVEQLALLSDFSKNELTAAVISSLYTVFVTSEEGEGLDFNLPAGADVDITDTTEEPNYTLESGAVIGLKPGEQVSFADPNRPNKNFDTFYNAILKEIGIGLNIPFEILQKHFTSSYTASRAGFLEAWKYFKKERSTLIQQFCDPVRTKVITEAVLLGRINAPGFLEDNYIKHAYLKCIWTGEVQGQIDEVKETKAAAMRVSEAFSTRAKESAQLNGTDFDDNARRAKVESKKMVEANLMERTSDA